MKTLHLLVFLAVLAMAAPVSGAEGRIRWITERYNFGAFAEDDGPVTCRFLMVNDGPAAVSIVSARATCGCTQPKYPVSSIAPGDTAAIEVTYDPQGRPGRFEKQVYVETSGTPRKSKLVITGIVIGSGETVARRFPVDLGPLKVTHPTVMLGEVNKGHIKTVYFEGYNRSADSLRVKIVKAPAYLEAIPVPTVSAPGEQSTIVFYVHSDKCPLYGLVEDSLTIETAPGQLHTLPVTLIVNEDFSNRSGSMADAPIAVMTESIDLGEVTRADGPVTATFTIANTGKDRLEIRRIYSADAGISAVAKSMSVKRGKRNEVTVTVDPAAITGDLVNARLTVITNDPLHPTHTVRVVGIIK